VLCKWICNRNLKAWKTDEQPDEGKEQYEMIDPCLSFPKKLLFTITIMRIEMGYAHCKHKLAWTFSKLAC